jgi:peptidoglycan hydrolase-like protein with peptidoglycan-binding domain
LSSWIGCSYLSGSSCHVTLAANSSVTVNFIVGTSTVAPVNIQPAITPNVTVVPIPIIYAGLTIGSKNSLVIGLQKFLNSQGMQISTNGPGSPGNETDYYGNLTDAAVKKYIAKVVASQRSANSQNSYSPVVNYGGTYSGGTTASVSTTTYPYMNSVFTIGMKGSNITALQTYLAGKNYVLKQHITGYYGPITDAAFKKYKFDMTPKTSNMAGCPVGFICQPKLATTIVTPAPIQYTPNVIVPKKLSQELSLGTRSLEVTTLQRFLNSKGYNITRVGPGSPGLETDYFGPATKDAVMRFQNVYANDVLIPVGLSQSNGFVGPDTIRLINRMIDTP